MDITGGFIASKRSSTNPQGLSNCSWNLFYWWVKISPLTEQIFSPEFSAFWL
jgi:hypothetical protein